MELALKNCSTCGRLFHAPTGIERCTICLDRSSGELAQVETALDAAPNSLSLSEIAAATNMKLNQIQSILSDAKVMSRQLRSEGRCRKCDRFGRLPDAEFCLACQLELYKSLGDAAAGLPDLEALGVSLRDRPMYVHDTLDEKRRRTGSHRFSVQTPSVKGRT